MCTCGLWFNSVVCFLLVKLFPVHGMELMFVVVWSSPQEFHDFWFGQRDEDGHSGKEKMGPPGRHGVPQIQDFTRHTLHPIRGCQVLVVRDLRGPCPSSCFSQPRLTEISVAVSVTTTVAPVFSPQHTRGIFQKHQSGYIVPCKQSFNLIYFIL